MHTTNQEYRDLVVYNNCQWLASLLEDTYKFSRCPECNADTIETIPVDNNEKYRLSFDKWRGIDIEFESDKGSS